MRDFALQTTAKRVLRRALRPLTHYNTQKALEPHTRFAEQLLAQLAHDRQLEIGAAPQIRSALLTRSDVAVMLIGDRAAQDASLVLKLPLTPDAEQSTTAHRQVIMTLHQLPALEAFCALVPRAISWGAFEGRPYYLETALAGASANELLRRNAEPATLKQDAARLIAQLHLSTIQRRVIDQASFTRLAGADLALLQQLAERWPEATVLRQKLSALEALLRDQLLGHELPFAWTHGDFWPGNLLVHNAAISGIVDWDRAAADQLPLLDILHLLAYTRKLQRRSELGEEVVEYLLPMAFAPNERALVQATLEQLELPADAQFLQASALLYWLRFAATNLARYPAFQTDSRWLTKNVFVVLKRGL